MKGIKGLWREFSRSMEAAAYAEGGEHETAKSIMRGTDVASAMGRDAKAAQGLKLKHSGAGR